MEIPIIPILVGGVVIMSIISWAEDNLKDDKKKTLKHWNKDSPLRKAFKTVADFQYSLDISDEENNKKLREFHQNAKTIAKTVLKGKYKDKVRTKMDTEYDKLMKDLKGKKDKNDIMKTFAEYVDKMEEITPDKSGTYERVEEGHFQPRRQDKGNPKGNPKGILKVAKSASVNDSDNDSVPIDPKWKAFGSKKRTKRKSKKKTKRKTKKRTRRR